MIDLITSKEVLEPETLKQLFPRMEYLGRQEVLVLKNIYHNNFVFEDMDVFENIVMVLNKIDPDVNKTEGVKPEWIWKALKTIKRIRPKMKYSDEVREYIRFIHKDTGILFYPSESGLAQHPSFEKYKKIAEEGPFPLTEETIDNIQAVHYLKIQEYLKRSELNGIGN